MEKIDIAGLKINAITKQELLDSLSQRIQSNQKTWVTTVYSEFLYAGLKDPKIMELLNQADIAVPDGIGIFWAHRFLSIPLTAKNYWLKILQALWQVKYSLVAILFYPKYIHSTLSDGREKVRNSDFQNNEDNEGRQKLGEKIVGADLIWDIAKKAAAQNLSIYLLGGFGDTPELVAEKLAKDINLGRIVYLSLNIAGYSNKNPNDI